MKLNVVETGTSDPWYAQGLKFTCTQCGNCCTGGPGYVWISREEIGRLAGHLGITPEQVVEKYCRKIDGRISFKERRSPAGLYDCIFLKEEKVARPKTSGDDEEIVYTKRTCTIYNFRPLQCRTWPFWPENLKSEKIWNHTSQRCPGMNTGKKYTLSQIAGIRDAKDWPQKPPTSK